MDLSGTVGFNMMFGSLLYDVHVFLMVFPYIRFYSGMGFQKELP